MTSTKRIRMRRLSTSLVALSILAAALAACGSNSGSGSFDAGSAKGKAVTIGLICSCSGSPLAGSTASAAKVAQAWAKSVNDSGGVNGHPIDIELKDDASNPGNSLTAVQQLISDHVSAILDETSYDSTWVKDVDAAKIPVIDGASVAPMFYTDANWFSSGQTLNSLVESNMQTAKLAGVTKLAEFYCAESPSCGGDALKANIAAAKAVGVPMVYTASVAATAPNYTAQCLAAKQAGVDGLFIATGAPVFIHVAEDCAKQDYHPTYIESGLGYTTQIASTPELANTLWAPFGSVPFFANTPGVQAMNAAVDKYYPSVRKDADTYSEAAVMSWTGGLLLSKAVEGSGVASGSDVTSADVIKGLTSLKDETLGGMAPPLTFVTGKPNPVNCWFVAQMSSGTPTLADGGKTSCSQVS